MSLKDVCVFKEMRVLWNLFNLNGSSEPRRQFLRLLPSPRWQSTFLTWKSSSNRSAHSTEFITQTLAKMCKSISPFQSKRLHTGTETYNKFRKQRINTHHKQISNKFLLLTIHHLVLFHNSLSHRLHFGFCLQELPTLLRRAALLQRDHDINPCSEASGMALWGW